MQRHSSDVTYLLLLLPLYCPLDLCCIKKLATSDSLLAELRAASYHAAPLGEEQSSQSSLPPSQQEVAQVVDEEAWKSVQVSSRHSSQAMWAEKRQDHSANASVESC
jgi:hypothetical protein